MDGAIGHIETGIDYCSEDFRMKGLDSIKVGMLQSRKVQVCPNGVSNAMQTFLLFVRESLDVTVYAFKSCMDVSTSFVQTESEVLCMVPIRDGDVFEVNRWERFLV